MNKPINVHTIVKKGEAIYSERLKAKNENGEPCVQLQIAGLRIEVIVDIGTSKCWNPALPKSNDPTIQ